MTGYTVHTGSTEKFSTGWDRVFAKKQRKAGRTTKKGSPKAMKSVGKVDNKKQPKRKKKDRG